MRPLSPRPVVECRLPEIRSPSGPRDRREAHVMPASQSIVSIVAGVLWRFLDQLAWSASPRPARLFHRPPGCVL